MATMTIQPSTSGWARLTIYDQNHVIPNVSYINPYIVEDLCGWLKSLSQEASNTVFLDREGNGTYLSCHDRDIIFTPIDGKPEFIFSLTDEEVNDMIDDFIASVKENIEIFVDWLDDDETPREISYKYLMNQITKLENER